MGSRYTIGLKNGDKQGCLAGFNGRNWNELLHEILKPLGFKIEQDDSFVNITLPTDMKRCLRIHERAMDRYSQSSDPAFQMYFNLSMEYDVTETLRNIIVFQELGLEVSLYAA
jgi:hypothetical protein